MIINLVQNLLDPAGKPLQPEGHETPINLRGVLSEVLLKTNPQVPISAEEKIMRYNLQSRLIGKDEIEFTANQIEILKNLVNLACDVLIGGQALTMLGK